MYLKEIGMLFDISGNLALPELRAYLNRHFGALQVEKVKTRLRLSLSLSVHPFLPREV